MKNLDCTSIGYENGWGSSAYKEIKTLCQRMQVYGSQSIISNQVDFMGHEYFSAKLAVMVRDHHEHIVMNNYYQL